MTWQSSCDGDALSATLAPADAPINSLLYSLKRIFRSLFGPAGEQAGESDRTDPKHPAHTWANTHPRVVRQRGGVCWQMPIEVPHSHEVKVERFPSCFVVSILKSGNGSHGASREQVLRRTIPINETIPEVEPKVEFQGNVLTLTFEAVQWSDSAARMASSSFTEEQEQLPR